MARLAGSLASTTYGSGARRSLLIAAVGASVVAYVSSNRRSDRGAGNRSELRARHHGPAVDCARLRRQSRIAVSPQRRAERSIRPPSHLPRRRRGMRARIDSCRRITERRALACRPPRPGIGGALTTTSALALLRTGFGHESSRAIGSWAGWSGGAALAIAIAGGFALDWLRSIGFHGACSLRPACR